MSLAFKVKFPSLRHHPTRLGLLRICISKGQGFIHVCEGILHRLMDFNFWGVHTSYKDKDVLHACV